jgi:hypothetical protein
MKNILLILLTTFSLSAQVKGVVKDSISGEPIAFVGVFTSKLESNFSSNKRGKFKIENLTKQDTLWFFTTGYKEKKIALKDLSNNVYLVPISNSAKNKNLDDYTQKKQWIDLQANGSSSFRTISTSSTSLKAYFIEGINSPNRNIILDKLSFKAVNLTPKTNVLKVRFFKADSLQNVIEEILLKPILLEVKSSQIKKANNVYHTNGFIEIDLLNKLIEIPKEGFFIAIELINIKDNQLVNVLSEPNSTLISPSINITNFQAIVYSYSKGKWQKVEKANYFPDFKISIATTKN